MSFLPGLTSTIGQLGGQYINLKLAEKEADLANDAAKEQFLRDVARDRLNNNAALARDSSLAAELAARVAGESGSSKRTVMLAALGVAGLVVVMMVIKR